MPDGQGTAAEQRRSSHRRVEASQDWPRGQGLFGPQPGWQSVSPEHAHRRGRHTVPAPQLRSFVQVDGRLLQMPHDACCSARRQMKGRPQVESSEQQLG
jgi:hypothetical protein